VALPDLTPEQRAAALEKAAEARKARAALKRIVGEYPESALAAKAAARLAAKAPKPGDRRP
jgi:outer membrane protein assembly factor BamD (BamD/ComL family)